jgi:CRISPR system Cascade subunit CasE
MFLTQAYLRRDALDNEDVTRLLQNLDGEHKLVWRLFADHPDRDRDFIFCRLREANVPTFVMVSHREPVDENNNWELDVSPYDPGVEEGDVVHFSLKANPTVKRDGRRHDIVMDAIKRMENEQDMDRDEIPPRHEIAKKEGRLWLLKRQKHYGYKLKGNRLKIDNYRQHKFKKLNNGRQIKLSSLDFTGLMEVTDEDQFRDALFNGVGPSKAYGFGCLLVKEFNEDVSLTPARRTVDA